MWPLLVDMIDDLGSYTRDTIGTTLIKDQMGITFLLLSRK